MEGELSSYGVFYEKLFTFSKEWQDGGRVQEGARYVRKQRSLSWNEVKLSERNRTGKSFENEDSSSYRVDRDLCEHESIDLAPAHNFNLHFRVYFMKLNSAQRIQTFALILKRYRQLVSQHGLFFLTPDHIRFSASGEPLVWINRNIDIDEPQWPLCSNRFGQVIALDGIREMIRKNLSERIYKYSKFDTLDQMIMYMERMQRRSSIHKKCQTIASIKSSSNKNDQTMC